MAFTLSGKTNINWSTLDEDDNVYPKYWIAGSELDGGIKIYKQESANVKKPGVLLRDVNNLIEKDNPYLFSTNSVGVLTKLKQCDTTPDNPSSDSTLSSYKLFIGGKTGSSGSYLWPAMTNAQYYNDVAEVEIILNNPSYANKEIELTGEFKTEKLYEYGEVNPSPGVTGQKAPHSIDSFAASGNVDAEWMYKRISNPNATNYNFVKNQLETEGGLTGLAAEPLQGVDSLTIPDPKKPGEGTWTKKITFDSAGAATFKIWAYRGARAYRIQLLIDNVYAQSYWDVYDFWSNKGYAVDYCHNKARENAENRISSKVFQYRGTLLLNVMSMVRYQITSEPLNKGGSGGKWQDYAIDGAIINAQYVRQVGWNNSTVQGSYQTRPAGNIIKHNTISPDTENYLLMRGDYDINQVFPWQYGLSMVNGIGPILQETGNKIEAWSNQIYSFSKKSNNGFDTNSYIHNEYKTDIAISRSELYGSDGLTARDINEYILPGTSDPIRAAGRSVRACN